MLNTHNEEVTGWRFEPIAVSKSFPLQPGFPPQESPHSQVHCGLKRDGLKSELGPEKKKPLYSIAFKYLYSAGAQPSFLTPSNPKAVRPKGQSVGDRPAKAARSTVFSASYGQHRGCINACLILFYCYYGSGSSMGHKWI